MEDVKELRKTGYYTFSNLRFNPCFNGRCKRTRQIRSCLYRLQTVSILVLMEDVKEQLSFSQTKTTQKSFNPCFNGRCKRTARGTIQ